MNQPTNNPSAPLTLAVGITTRHAGESLLSAARSIYASPGVEPFRFIIIADGIPPEPFLISELQRLGVDVVWNSTEGSITKKMKELLDRVESDIFLITHDDVLFKPNVLSEILRRFEQHPQTTFIGIRNQPLPGNSYIEEIIGIGTNVVRRIARSWNNGDNYLSVVGRCMAFRTQFLREKFNIPEDLTSSDAYFYFENKRVGGKYEYVDDLVLYFRNPQTLREHLRKSSRFQHSKQEMKKFFGDLESEYAIPASQIIRAVLSEFGRAPITTMLYGVLYLYTRLFHISADRSLDPLWDIDPTTKKITSDKRI